LKGKTVWYIVPRRDLIRQMNETFSDFGIEHGYVAAGYEHNPFVTAHICSLGSVGARLAKVVPPNLAFIDETHFGGEGLDKLVKWLKERGVWIVGLSATPWKMSGQGLGCWYDDLVCGPSIRWLIDNKRLADYRAFAPDTLDLSMIDVVGGDYAKGQLSEKMEQDRVLIGNSVKHYRTHAMGRLGVTFAVSRKHSEMLAQAYRDAGVPAMHMDGETPELERIRIARAFARRELLQLCNAELLTFGYDLASASGDKGVCIEVMTDCQPTRSLAKQMQKNGRNLRYDPQPHLFFDHANNFATHGLPCMDREWTLESRKKRQGSGERTLPARSCSKCYFVHHPAPRCPSCGYVYPVEAREIKEIEGELRELEIKQQKKEKRMEVGQAKTVEDLQRIADERGYARGWVFKQMQLKGIRK
jgi:superfamily II DNA or RNA helicase